MHWLKSILVGLIVFIVISLSGFIIDVIFKSGGAGKVSMCFLWIALVISLFLFIKGNYQGLSILNPNLTKIFLLILSFVLSILQLAICYIISVASALYVLAPVMTKLGYYVTMP